MTPTVTHLRPRRQRPPLVQETLPIAEQVRRALMGNYRRVREADGAVSEGERVASAVLAGKRGAEVTGGARARLSFPADVDGATAASTTSRSSAARRFDAWEVKALDRLPDPALDEAQPRRFDAPWGLGAREDLNAKLWARRAHVGLGHAVRGDAPARAARPGSAISPELLGPGHAGASWNTSSARSSTASPWAGGHVSTPVRSRSSPPRRPPRPSPPDTRSSSAASVSSRATTAADAFGSFLLAVPQPLPVRSTWDTPVTSVFASPPHRGIE